ncbi:tetratricopeptide repeat protein [Tunturiibacter gelidoferens]|uniref:Tetratricopeptide (TPR) repeat protein n=1 Tax=Tunturiibacter lichenicola TaxID=2051959 RepID=A0A7Y9NLX1_9BACT|nr:tetratricopeptide repeat protein [Edaphobacter lichenicola]NYF51781.1 tetratricopeptide (TPR) repeat protein [Edaphobacter lichenicola]
MSKAHQLRLVVLCGWFLLCAAFAVRNSEAEALAAQDGPSQNLDRQFQSAVAQYHAGKYTEAAVQLESILPSVPKSFEVREILGLTYAALSENEKAVEQLAIAVRLKPDSGAARTNLATALASSGKLELAEAQFRRALALEPGDFGANHNLADFYLQTNRIANALPLLEQAQRINPSSYSNGYDLALVYFLMGRLEDARQLVQNMVKQKNTGELHNLLGQIEEKDGRYLQAANEFQIAAQMDPSEDNLFAWGSELLLHRTYEPAIDVFQQATRHYPNSPRLLIGLGMALYSQGRYEESIKSLLTAADLDPTDARCYLFLSKSYLSSPNQADDVIERFRRYSELQPDNALAKYYYAVSLWKGKRLEGPSVDFRAVESLLHKAIALDGTLADAHLQLGILYADQHELSKSLPEYRRALELNPSLPDAHYRLGQYYVRAGQKDHAREEFALYQRLQAQHMAAVDKERAEVQQFVYSAKPGSVTKP